MVSSSERLKSEIDRYLNNNPKYLVGTESADKRRVFIGLLPRLEEVQGFYKKLKSLYFNDFPGAILDQLLLEIEADHRLYTNMFSYPDIDKSIRIDDLIEEASGRIFHLNRTWSFLFQMGEPKNETERKLQDLFDEYNERLPKLENDLLKTDTLSREVLGQVRSLSAEVGVTVQSRVFEEEADRHAEEASAWLRTSKISGLLLLALCVGGLLLHKWEWLQPGNLQQAIQFGLSKFAMLAVVAYVFIKSIKNYHNHKHNLIIATHRHNALKTYRAIVEGSDDSATQNIVLAQAAACIFSPHDTGFAQGNADGSSTQKAVLEVLASASSK